MYLDGGRANQQNGHIMLSYQWENQPTVKRIAEDLEKKGYKVWIDICKMQGNIMDAMAEAVEKADLIIVCVSRKYKNSANTRSGKAVY